METSLAFRAWFIVSDVSIITLQPHEMLHDDDHYKPKIQSGRNSFYKLFFLFEYNLEVYPSLVV